MRNIFQWKIDGEKIVSRKFYITLNRYNDKWIVLYSTCHLHANAVEKSTNDEKINIWYAMHSIKLYFKYDLIKCKNGAIWTPAVAFKLDALLRSDCAPNWIEVNACIMYKIYIYMHLRSYKMILWSINNQLCHGHTRVYMKAWNCTYTEHAHPPLPINLPKWVCVLEFHGKWLSFYAVPQALEFQSSINCTPLQPLHKLTYAVTVIVCIPKKGIIQCRKYQIALLKYEFFE